MEGPRPSQKPIPARERLIFALDVASHDEALAWVERLGDAVHFYKVGLELALAGDLRALLSELARRRKRVFADLKLFDIPETVAGAVRQLAKSGVDFATVHSGGGTVEAACREKGGVAILAVTVLTSFDAGDLDEPGHPRSLEELVLARARRALAQGADGLVASGLEAAALRRALGSEFLIVSPGIRPAGARSADDQKRVVDVAEAFRNGADHIVVGRPIRHAADPRAAAAGIQATIASLFA